MGPHTMKRLGIVVIVVAGTSLILRDAWYAIDSRMETMGKLMFVLFGWLWSSGDIPAAPWAGLPLAVVIASTIRLARAAPSMPTFLTGLAFLIVMSGTLVFGKLAYQLSFVPMRDILQTAMCVALGVVAYCQYPAGSTHHETAMPPNADEVNVSTRALLGSLAGGLLGAAVGFVLRPTNPLVGQLPIGTVVTRGAFLEGMDRLIVPLAEYSFNVMFGGFLLGSVAGALTVYMVMRSPGIGQDALQVPSSYPTKQCPFCAETIKAVANVCRFCGRDLVQEDEASNARSGGQLQ